jgi:hypothetical protein
MCKGKLDCMQMVGGLFSSAYPSHPTWEGSLGGLRDQPVRFDPSVPVKSAETRSRLRCDRNHAEVRRRLSVRQEQYTTSVSSYRVLMHMLIPNVRLVYVVFAD